MKAKEKKKRKTKNQKDLEGQQMLDYCPREKRDTIRHDREVWGSWRIDI